MKLIVTHEPFTALQGSTMKKLAYSVAFAALASPVMAQEEICPAIGYLASSVMEQRQKGVPISGLMAAIGQKATEGENFAALAEIAREMVIDAYETPQFQTAENKEEAVAEFRNKFELACYQHWQ